MITLTRLNGEKFMVNADLIEFIEITPDTVISMTTGRKIVVTESDIEVRDRVIEYKHIINAEPRVKEQEYIIENTEF